MEKFITTFLVFIVNYIQFHCNYDVAIHTHESREKVMESKVVKMTDKL